jgi:type I restriction enzyme S subunit
MNNSFPYIKLKEICDVNQGLQIPIEERYKEIAPNRYFYITVQFLKASHINKFYVENPPSSSICNKDDILIVRTGSTGQIVTGVNGCFHNNFFKVNFNKEVIHGRYLYHCLNTKEKYKEMLRRAGVTTIPDLNHFMFLDMEIPLPEKAVQIEIAKTLDSLDSKIELNNRINAELEAMAKTIYDYWFVQFDFPDQNGKPYKASGGKMVWNEKLKREIPEGWETEGIESSCSIIDCLHSKKSDLLFDDEDSYLLQLENIKEDGLLDLSNKYYVSKDEYKRWTSKIEVKENDILVTNAGRVAATAQIPKNVFAGIGRNITAIRPNTISPTYLFLSFRGADIKRQIRLNTDSGAFFTSFNVKGIKQIQLLRPNNNIEAKFEATVLPIRQKRELNNAENQKLAELRDWLLPMLMNGQVKVKEATEYLQSPNNLSMAAEPEVGYGE